MKIVLAFKIITIPIPIYEENIKNKQVLSLHYVNQAPQAIILTDTGMVSGVV